MFRRPSSSLLLQRNHHYNHSPLIWRLSTERRLLLYGWFFYSLRRLWKREDGQGRLRNLERFCFPDECSPPFGRTTSASAITEAIPPSPTSVSFPFCLNRDVKNGKESWRREEEKVWEAEDKAWAPPRLVPLPLCCSLRFQREKVPHFSSFLSFFLLLLPLLRLVPSAIHGKFSSLFSSFSSSFFQRVVLQVPRDFFAPPCAIQDELSGECKKIRRKKKGEGEGPKGTPWTWSSIPSPSEMPVSTTTTMMMRSDGNVEKRVDTGMDGDTGRHHYSRSSRVDEVGRRVNSFGSSHFYFSSSSPGHFRRWDRSSHGKRGAGVGREVVARGGEATLNISYRFAASSSHGGSSSNHHYSNINNSNHTHTTTGPHAGSSSPESAHRRFPSLSSSSSSSARSSSSTSSGGGRASSSGGGGASVRRTLTHGTAGRGSGRGGTLSAPSSAAAVSTGRAALRAAAVAGGGVRMVGGVKKKIAPSFPRPTRAVSASSSTTGGAASAAASSSIPLGSRSSLSEMRSSNGKGLFSPSSSSTTTGHASSSLPNTTTSTTTSSSSPSFRATMRRRSIGRSTSTEGRGGGGGLGAGGGGALRVTTTRMATTTTPPPPCTSSSSSSANSGSPRFSGGLSSSSSSALASSTATATSKRRKKIIRARRRHGRSRHSAIRVMNPTAIAAAATTGTTTTKNRIKMKKKKNLLHHRRLLHHHHHRRRRRLHPSSPSPHHSRRRSILKKETTSSSTSSAGAGSSGGGTTTLTTSLTSGGHTSSHSNSSHTSPTTPTIPTTPSYRRRRRASRSSTSRSRSRSSGGGGGGTSSTRKKTSRRGRNSIEKRAPSKMGKIKKKKKKISVCVLSSSYKGTDSETAELDNFVCTPAHYITKKNRHKYRFTSVEVEKNDVYRVIRELVSTQKYDLFFNLCDGGQDEKRAGVEVIHALEDLNAPFTGADSRRFEPSKIDMKLLVHASGVRVPNYALLRKVEGLAKRCCHLRFPVIVKHLTGYASVGIQKDNLCRNIDQLRAKVTTFIARFNHALVEEFIVGREGTVLATADPNTPGGVKVFQPLMFNFLSGPDDFAYFDKKWKAEMNESSHVLLPPSDPAFPGIINMACNAFHFILNGVGYGRVDFRIDQRNNEPVFLEINPNCGMWYNQKDGGDYADLMVMADPHWTHEKFFYSAFKQAVKYQAIHKPWYLVSQDKNGAFTARATRTVPEHHCLFGDAADPVPVVVRALYKIKGPLPVVPSSPSSSSSTVSSSIGSSSGNSTITTATGGTTTATTTASNNNNLSQTSGASERGKDGEASGKNPNLDGKGATTSSAASSTTTTSSSTSGGASTVESKEKAGAVVQSVAEAEAEEEEEDALSNTVSCVVIRADGRPYVTVTIRHSCEPNMQLIHGRTLTCATKRPISVGEELSIDYGTLRDENMPCFTCTCGTKKCRNIILPTPPTARTIEPKTMRKILREKKKQWLKEKEEREAEKMLKKRSRASAGSSSSSSGTHSHHTNGSHSSSSSTTGGSG